ncbi:MAG: rod shape-determining protein MreD [Planctomycetota bacterium]
MHWVGLILGAGVLATLQTSVAPLVSIWGTGPDWILVAVVFAALHTTGSWAVVTGWVLGLTADLLTVDTIGLLAVSYGCTAWMVSTVREHVFARRAVTLGVLTLGVGGLLRSAWLVILCVRNDWDLLSAAGWVQEAIFPAMYTGLWGLVLHFPARGVLSVMRSGGHVRRDSSTRGRGRADV